MALILPTLFIAVGCVDNTLLTLHHMTANAGTFGAIFGRCHRAFQFLTGKTSNLNPEYGQFSEHLKLIFLS